VEARPDSAWLRFFYQYGPGEDERRLVASACRAVLRGDPVKVSPGEQRRSFLHIDDVAAAVVAVAESRLAGCVNIGATDASSIREIVTTIGALGGRPDLIQLGAVPYYEGEPMLIQADNRKLKSTGWTERFTLQQGLRDTFEWWKRLTQ
jgi:nucleoside-diphosphate-sugar epimerase